MIEKRDPSGPFFLGKYPTYLNNFTCLFGRFVVLAPGSELPLSLTVLDFFCLVNETDGWVSP